MKERKSTKDRFVEMFNRSNGSTMEPDDVDVNYVASVDEDNVTVEIVAFDDRTDKILLTVTRVGLTEFFGTNELFVDCEETNAEFVKSAILDTYGFVVEPPMAIVKVTDGEWLLYAGSTNYLFSGVIKVSVRPVGFLFGRKLKLHLNLADALGTDGRCNIDAYLKPVPAISPIRESDGKLIPSQTTIVNDVTGQTLVAIMNAVTGEDWVLKGTWKVDFNLYGAEVLYNGPNVGIWFNGHASDSHVLVVKMGDLCRNLGGTVKLGYQSKNKKRLIGLLIGQTTLGTVKFT